uniref:Uncharacterized protein n=1 Tax=Rhizophagus irregularis (strain DAOM 181602 / DAOM 197198 / MUCL 43194) TaxID=747089 RepID=U9UK05_RHIID
MHLHVNWSRQLDIVQKYWTKVNLLQIPLVSKYNLTWSGRFQLVQFQLYKCFSIGYCPIPSLLIIERKHFL